MKIYSKRHPRPKLVILDELPFTYPVVRLPHTTFYSPPPDELTYFAITRKSALDCIDAQKLIDTVRTSVWVYVNGEQV